MARSRGSEIFPITTTMIMVGTIMVGMIMATVESANTCSFFSRSAG
jgi:hypothetical protein